VRNRSRSDLLILCKAHPDAWPDPLPLGNWRICRFRGPACLRVLDGRLNVAVDGSGAVYLPSAPKALVNSAPVARLLQSDFERYGDAFRSTNFLFALQAVLSGDRAEPLAGAAQALYGPVHRRPRPRVCSRDLRLRHTLISRFGSSRDSFVPERALYGTVSRYAF
jgi:hypothetical protein